MRRQQIEALVYPRLLVLRLLGDRDCVNGTSFDATSLRCRDCDMNRECHWATCVNEFVDADSTPEHTLNASLRHGVNLVEHYHRELRHDETVCTCEACTWVRDAQRLIEAFETKLRPNPYRPVH